MVRPYRLGDLRHVGVDQQLLHQARGDEGGRGRSGGSRRRGGVETVGIDATSLDTATVIVRLAGGTGLGLLVGLERELDGHEAGVRTHGLLALGAALLGALSVGGFHEFVALRNETNVQVDVTRIASYVAAGIGFLGGGVILKRGHQVKGLTTAASLWAVSAIGLAAGIGFWAGALTATALALLSLLADSPLRALTNRVRPHPARLVVTLAPGADVAEILAVLGDRVRAVGTSEPEGDRIQVGLRRVRPTERNRLIGRLLALPGVIAVDHHDDPGGDPANATTTV